VGLTWVDTTILSATCGAGWLTIAYSGIARSRGWLCGTAFSNPLSLLHGLAFLSFFGAPIIASARAHWWTGAIILVVGNIFVRIVLSVFGRRVPLVALAGLLLGLIASAVVAAGR
jgi:hypothetical protein